MAEELKDKHAERVHAKVFGRGGKLYADARKNEEDKEGTVTELPRGADRPDPKPKKEERGEPAGPPPIPWIGPRPEDLKKPAFNWRGLFSTLLELLGTACVAAGAWRLAPWLGLIVLGVCLIIVGFATDAPLQVRPMRVKQVKQ
jgi:hypothetical protein